jgi:predicted PurR-regulated permease PerM
MNNTDRGLLFLALFITCFYFVFDEFFGQKRISQWAAMLTPDIPSIGQQVQTTINNFYNGVQKAMNNPEQAIQSKQQAKDKVQNDPAWKKNPGAQKELEKLIDKFYGNPMT